jgi:hypothetical protein
VGSERVSIESDRILNARNWLVGNLLAKDFGADDDCGLLKREAWLFFVRAIY